MSQENCLNPRSIMITIVNWCRQVLEEIHPKLDTLDARHRELTKKHLTNSRVTYTPERTRCAYIRSSVPLYASAITYVVTHEPELTFLFDTPQFVDQKLHNNSIHVVSIGCGPGTDMIGILKHLINKWEFGTLPAAPPDLHFLLCDVVPNWRDNINSFEKVVRTSSQHFCRGGGQQQEGLSFENSFFECDISHPSFAINFLTRPTFKNGDLFIFSMLLSDIRKEAGFGELNRVQKNVRKIFEHAKPNAYFLFIDLSQEHVLENIRNIFENQEFHGRLVKIREHSGKFVLLPHQENFKDFGQYFSLESDCGPKFEENLTYFVYRKCQ